MVRLLRLFVHVAVLRVGVFSGRRSDDAAAERGGRLRRRLPDAADRQLALRPHCGQARTAHLDDDRGRHDVRRIADGGGAADLCHDRRRRAGAAAGRSAAAGPVGRRRIRHQRDLHERGGAAPASRLLCVVPVRDADRRPAAGGAGAGDHAAVSVRGGAQGVGLAHPVRDRRDGCRGRLLPAALAGRDDFGRGATAEGRRNDQGSVPLSALVLHRARIHRRRLAGFLYLHHLHAEVPGQHRRHERQRPRAAS